MALIDYKHHNQERVIMKLYKFRSWLAKFLKLALVLIITIEMMATTPFALTIKEEKDLGREVMQYVSRQYNFINDPLITDTINRVGRKILQAAGPQPFEYKFYVIRTDVYNAFATPAGQVFINSGLLEIMDTEDQLAGILSHEIAHVICRHISRRLQQAKKVQIATLAGLVAGIFLGVGGAGAAGNALAVGSMAAGQSAMLSYSRKDEIQADEIGLINLAKAGYSAKGLLKVLKAIRSKQWFGSEQVPTYLKTHPAVEARLAYIDTWIAQNEKAGQSFPADTESARRSYALMHTYFLGRFGKLENAAKRFQSSLKANPKAPLAQYGLGLVLIRSGKLLEAEKRLTAAVSYMPLDSLLLKDLGRLYFLEGNWQASIKTLHKALDLGGKHPEILFYLGRSQAESGETNQAIETLQKLITSYPDFPDGYFFLGQLTGKVGDLPAAHYYLGIFYLKKHKNSNARFHFQRALEKTNDPKLKAKLRNYLASLPKPAKAASHN